MPQTASLKPVDVIQSTIGDFGRWQLKISVLMALLKFPVAWFQMSIVFLAPPTQFWCEPYTNWTINEQLLRHEGLNEGFCQKHVVEPNNLRKIDCPDGFEYNRTIVHSSIITEWDLVCDNKRLVDIAQITFMFGILIGNIIVGYLADRKGRKITLMSCIVVQAVLGIVAAKMPWYWGFIAARFVLAIATGGIIVVSFVMCMEVVGGPMRAIVPILYQIPYGFGTSIMAGLAFHYRNWRDLQLALSLLSSLYVFYLWFVPESPRWLLVTGKPQKAIRILESAARTNKRNNHIRKIITDMELNRTVVKPKVTSLFSNFELRKRTLLLYVNWLIGGITFYAFSQYIGKIGSNLYLTAALTGVVALPGTLLCVYVIRRYGRKFTIAAASLLTSVCFFCILSVPTGVYYQDWPRMAIAGLGIVGLSISMPAMYLFTGELYPTTLRNVGVGSSVMFSRIGSMFAPLVVAMQDVSSYLPLIVLSAAAALQTCLILLLPETKGKALPESVADLNTPDKEMIDASKSFMSEQNSKDIVDSNDIAAFA